MYACMHVCMYAGMQTGNKHTVHAHEWIRAIYMTSQVGLFHSLLPKSCPRCLAWEIRHSRPHTDTYAYTQPSVRITSQFHYMKAYRVRDVLVHARLENQVGNDLSPATQRNATPNVTASGISYIPDTNMHACMYFVCNVALKCVFV